MVQHSHSNKLITKAEKGTLGPRQLVKLHEEYDESIKYQMDFIEQLVSRAILTKLHAINYKIKYYLLTKLQSVEKSFDSEMEQIFDPTDFDFNLTDLIPAVKMGYDYQRKAFTGKLQDRGIKNKNVVSAIGINFNPPTTKYIDLVRQREDYLSDLIKNNTFNMVKDTITSNIKEGKTYNEIAQKIGQNTKIGIAEARAEVIARTESNWALNEGNRMYADDIGVSQYQVSLAKDACSICVAETNHGKKKYSIDESDVLPIHPNCRCVMISVIPKSWYTLPEEEPFYDMLPEEYLQAPKEGISQPEVALPNKFEYHQPEYIRVDKMPDGREVNNIVGDERLLAQWQGKDRMIETYHGQDDSHFLKNINMTAGQEAQTYGLVSGSTNKFGRGLYTTLSESEASIYGQGLRVGQTFSDPSVYKVYIKPDKVKILDYSPDLLKSGEFTSFANREKSLRTTNLRSKLGDLETQLIKGTIDQKSYETTANMIRYKFSTEPDMLLESYAKSRGFGAIRIPRTLGDDFAVFDTTEKFILNNPIKPGSLIPKLND